MQDELKIVAARYEQQCLLCRDAIEASSPIVKIADDILAGVEHGIWVHEQCGREWLKLHPERPPLLNLGTWVTITASQNCWSCMREGRSGEALIPPGHRAYMIIVAGRGYERICKLCWMRRNL